MDTTITIVEEIQQTFGGAVLATEHARDGIPVIAVLSDGAREADAIDDYRGFFWKRPLLGAIFTLALLSLAGIPLTAGFLAKFYIIAAGASSSTWALLIVLVVTSVIGLFYYLRIVVAIYSNLPSATEMVQPVSFPVSLAGSCTLVVLAIVLVWFGVYPQPLLRLIGGLFPH
jgi:NADH-quinone oxidoreductase subunit N